MVNKLKLLIVEGNTKEENINFDNAGCVPQSQNFKLHIEKLEPNSEIDIVEPGNDNSILKIISSLKKYDGIVLTGSTLRIENDSDEVIARNWNGGPRGYKIKRTEKYWSKVAKQLNS